MKACTLVEGSLEVKLPMERKKGGKSQRRRDREKREDQRRERVTRKMQVHEKVEKSRNNVLFQ